MADFGASRILKQNETFVSEQTVSFNTTIAGTEVFMSPEMKSGQKNGAKTDVWSLAITIGFLLGWNKCCPANFKGGVPGFMKACAEGKNNLLLAKNDIFVSPVLLNMLKNMFFVSVDRRYSMQ